VQNGRALVGALEVDYPEYPHDESLPAQLYVRPHELEIRQAPNGVPSLRAEVQRVNAASGVAKVYVQSHEFGIGLNVELSKDRYNELELKPGDTVYVSPRRVRVFVPDYAAPEYVI
jgi:sulfate transport system ATP-binding protein